MSNQFENDEELDGLVPEHQEKGGFDLGAFAAELTMGRDQSLDRQPTAQEIWKEETAKPADDADEYVDPDALPEDYDDVKAWEETNHAAMLAKGLDDNGDPIPEPDPVAVKEVAEAATRSTVESTQRTLAQLNQQQFDQMVAVQNQQLAALEAEVPDFSEDPERHTATMFALQQARFTAAEQQRQAKAMGDNFTRSVTEALPFGLEAERQVRATTPDYTEALDYLHESIARKMVAERPGTSREEVNRTQAMATAVFLKDCQAKGINPAQRLYETAVQFGFKGKGLGTVQAPRARTGKPTPTLEEVARMSEEEFETFFAEAKRYGTADEQPMFGGGAKR
ncbi:hypothetical protein [Pseudomonas mandelii]|uniref:hypothetical protein n=1 Tax=Pseudomonas mandelii TaxID=75612 RepID=UPI003C782FC0